MYGVGTYLLAEGRGTGRAELVREDLVLANGAYTDDALEHKDVAEHLPLNLRRSGIASPLHNPCKRLHQSLSLQDPAQSHKKHEDLSLRCIPHCSLYISVFSHIFWEQDNRLDLPLST